MFNKPTEKVLSINELLTLIDEISSAGGSPSGAPPSIEGTTKPLDKTKKRKYKLEEVMEMVDTCLKEDVQDE